MSPAKARAAVQKLFKPKHEGDLTFTGTKKIGGYFATLPAVSSNITHSMAYGVDREGIVVNFGKNSQQAGSVVRRQDFSEPNRPDPRNLEADLIKKYGEPSFLYRHNGIVDIWWQNSANGKPEHWPNPAYAQICEPQTNGHGLGEFNFDIPDAFKSQCGTRFTLDMILIRIKAAQSWSKLWRLI